MNANIKDNVLHNGNPEINPAAKPLFSLGKLEVGDVVYSRAQKYIVVETGIRVRSEHGRLFEHAIKAASETSKYETILVNEQEDTDFSGIWE